MLRSKRASAGNDGLGRAESRPSRIGPISLGMKQMGARSAGNPHAACDVAGAGNAAWSRWCDTRRRKSEPTGNTNFDLNRRASLRPYPPAQPKKLVTTKDVYVYQALKTPQFWLIWIVLCMNVTAGIGVLGQASAMSQEMLPGRVTAAAAGGFVGLLSIFNMAGRFFWASTSDHIGRKNTYFVFFALGVVLYALVPFSAARGIW